MALRIAIVGPGRVGRAIGRRLAAAGSRFELLGFVGRSTGAAADAARWCGAGRSLGFEDLARAHVVLFAVGDMELGAAVASALAAAQPRRCALWLHTSGQAGLEVFASAAAAGLRCGALHPVAPFPDAETGVRTMDGAPAVLLGDARCERLLLVLCAQLGLVPIRSGPGDRALYHAGCALAANGLTALCAIVDRLLAAAGGLQATDRTRIAEALLRNALATSGMIGPVAALSGPVRRGDAATVQLHLRTLALAVPEAAATYRALMTAALDLAVRAGLDPTAAAAVRAVLEAQLPGAPPAG